MQIWIVVIVGKSKRKIALALSCWEDEGKGEELEECFVYQIVMNTKSQLV